MAHGGKRPGAGRPRGGANKKTREIADRAASEGITPLEVMLKAMRDAYEGGNMDDAARYARDAAPYTHPRLQQIEQKSEVTVQKAVSDAPLTPDEWAAQHGSNAPH